MKSRKKILQKKKHREKKKEMHINSKWYGFENKRKKEAIQEYKKRKILFADLKKKQ